MRNLLAVSWWFPPLLGPRSIQVAKTLHTLGDQGWQVSLLTPALDVLPLGTRLDQKLLDAYGKNIQLLRIPAARSMQLAQVVRKFFPSLALLPDDQLLWAKKVVKELSSRMDLDQFQALITFGQPWSDHLIGEKVKAQSGLPWLAHFSDPWADNPYNTTLNAAQIDKMRIMEARTVVQADKLIFTNQPTLDLVMRNYPPALKPKAAVIPHGYDKRILADLPQPKLKKSPTKLSFMHLGNIYRIRSPKSLFQAIALLKAEPGLLEHLEFIFVGAISDRGKWERFLSDNQISEFVRFEAPVPYFDSLAIGASADVLLTIDAPNDVESVFLPSKLVDYLALQKPILGISPERGVTASLLKSLSMPLASPSQPAEIAKRIHALYDDWKKGDLHLPVNFSRIAAEYDIEATTQRLAGILSGTIANSS